MKNKTLLEATSRYKKISALTQEIEHKLQEYPSGRIEIKHISNRSYYYLVTSGSEERLLINEDELIEKLLQKNYLKKVLKCSIRETDVLQRLINSYPDSLAEDIYSTLSAERQKFVKPIIPTTEQFVKEWQEKPYTPKEIKEGTPVYETLRKERVRSKSEQIIADRLYVNVIPYKY